MTPRPRRSLLLTFTAAAVLGLTGCGGGGSSTADGVSAGAEVARHNNADVAFAGDMVLHHRQAVEMAQMVLDRGSKAEVKALAARIKAAQDPEITQLAAFLRSVGEKVPSGSGGHGGGHGGGGPMGMMSEDDMAELMDLSGAALEKLFLTMMVEHHEGALDMATDQVEDGQSTEMTALAEQIAAAQTAEIAEMKALLATYS